MRAPGLRDGSRTIALVLLAPIAATCVLTGCGQKSGSGFTSVDAPALVPPVPDADKQAVQVVVNQFVADVQGAKYADAVKLMSPELARKMPAPVLAKSAKHDFRAFVKSTGWTFEAIQYTGRDKSVIARAHFSGADGIVYNTNFRLNADRRIDMFLPPSKPGIPVAGGALKTAGRPPG